MLLTEHDSSLPFRFQVARWSQSRQLALTPRLVHRIRGAELASGVRYFKTDTSCAPQTRFESTSDTRLDGQAVADCSTVSRIRRKTTVKCHRDRHGNSSVFRCTVPRSGFSYVLAECDLKLRERIKRRKPAPKFEPLLKRSAQRSCDAHRGPDQRGRMFARDRAYEKAASRMAGFQPSARWIDATTRLSEPIALKK